MTNILNKLLLGILVLAIMACQSNTDEQTAKNMTAADILGNPAYQAISFGGYRHTTRDTVPTIAELKEDLKLLSAMNIKLMRTYNTQLFGETKNLLEAISQLKAEDGNFEMYIMLGAWIECKGAFTDSPDHTLPHVESNTAEIEAAVAFAKAYPDIIKVIAVGNEAMVHWAASYFVHPREILAWVNHLKTLRSKGEIPADLWITSSDNFASWGGGDSSYYNNDLTELIKAVDFLSVHTYPFHDTHYNPDFWNKPYPANISDKRILIDSAMNRAGNYAMQQFEAVAKYVESLGLKKPLHIGETGWASMDHDLYGNSGSHAADEYKQKLYYDFMRNWTNKAGISCFFFEAFDEPWKDKNNPAGSENHFGLIDINSRAKYPIWHLVDNGTFKGLTRNGKPITKTFGGDTALLWKTVLPPVVK